jgi:acetyltransferase-like isoleucine patch superfamily enzyme
VVIERLARRVRLSLIRRAGLQIPDDCRIGGLSAWPTFGSEPYLISIGHRVGIAAKVVFITHDGGTWAFRRKPGFEHVIKYGRITIHDDSIIGYGAILLPGIEIGPNSVVAAGAVVGRSVPPNMLAAGVPARVFMSIDDYAEQALANMPEIDRAKYRKNKRDELLRAFPRPW